MRVGTLMKRVLEDIPAKAVAIETGYSPDAYYAACHGKRKLPQDKNARRRLSELHPAAGLAVAYEDTNYSCFAYIEGDRHIQTLMQLAIKEGVEAEDKIRKLCWRLLGKTKPEDLTPEDVVELKAAVKEVLDSIRSDLNLVIGIDEHFRLGVTELMAKEKHGSSRQARNRV